MGLPLGARQVSERGGRHLWSSHDARRRHRICFSRTARRESRRKAYATNWHIDLPGVITVALPRHQYESRHNANVCIKGLCPRFSSEHCKTFAPRLRLHVRKLYTTVACAYGIQTLALCCLRLFVHPVLARTTSSVSTLRRTGGMFRPLARVIAISTASAARREGEGSIDVSASAREEASAELSQPMTSTSRPGTKPSFRSARIAPCAHWSL